MLAALRVTIDAAGRIVVPRPLRQVLDLNPGHTLEIRAGDGLLEVEFVAVPMTLEGRGKKSVVTGPEKELPALTAAEIRQTMASIQRQGGLKTGVVVAAIASWHERQEREGAALDDGARAIKHFALETYSVLTRLPHDTGAVAN